MHNRNKSFFCKRSALSTELQFFASRSEVKLVKVSNRYGWQSLIFDIICIMLTKPNISA